MVFRFLKGCHCFEALTDQNLIAQNDLKGRNHLALRSKRKEARLSSISLSLLHAVFFGQTAVLAIPKNLSGENHGIWRQPIPSVSFQDFGWVTFG